MATAETKTFCIGLPFRAVFLYPTGEKNMNAYTEANLSSNLKSLSRGKKLVLLVFIIWAAQAIPKWTLAITADGESSAKIVGFFITPMYQQLAENKPPSEPVRTRG